MKKKPIYIGTLEEFQAIDFTPIYYLKLARGVRAGQTLRVDMADKKVFIDVNTTPN